MILVRPFTEADDVAGFHAAQGHPHLARAARPAHAALVARGMGRPCVCGRRRSSRSTSRARRVQRGRHASSREGDLIAIDGIDRAWSPLDDVPLMSPRSASEFETVLGWADELRALGVRANADTPEDAAKAREFGAEGIGLCRTEHMFFGDATASRRCGAMIMAEHRARTRARRRSTSCCRSSRSRLRGALRGDERAAGDDPAARPAAARVPPARRGRRAGGRARPDRGSDDLEELERTLDRVHALQETNPMLGTRGVRLGVLHPESTRCRCARSCAAALAVASARRGAAGRDHVPLSPTSRSSSSMRELIERVVDEEGGERASSCSIGTMIELPRACFVADRIAEHADFFSFGTNDLTQTALGLLARRRRGRVPGPLHRARRSSTAARSRRSTSPGWAELVRLAAWAGPRGASRPQARHLRRARRRPGLDRASSSWPGSTTSAARPTACRSRGWRRRRPPSRRAGRRSRRLRLGAMASRGDSDLRASGSSALGGRVRSRRSPTPLLPRAARASRSPTPITARRSSATATGSCTRRRSGGSSTRPRSSSRPRATTTAPG